MSRKSKTDPTMLRELSAALVTWCRENGIGVRQCSPYQWNVTEPIQHIILAVYPGSGKIYASELHYVGTGLVDRTGTTYEFGTEDQMVEHLENIIYAVDKA